ncbi:MAG: hypothetical protein OFPII_20450 [Osedax symbiont Rs1]|nr:MAG: hypothetical protein OFPII_20450 [Osedax symbiont Rs1]
MTWQHHIAQALDCTSISKRATEAMDFMQVCFYLAAPGLSRTEQPIAWHTQ